MRFEKLTFDNLKGAQQVANTWQSNLVEIAKRLSFRAALQPNIRTITADDSAGLNDYTILGDATLAGVEITLPDPTLPTSYCKIYAIKKIDVSVNTVTTDLDVDGTPLSLGTQYDRAMIQSDGTAWWRIA